MIKDLKELQKLFKLCRGQGVTSIKFEGVEIIFGDMPITQSQMQEASEQEDKYAGFPQGELSPEQLAFYAVGGLPKDDPDNRDMN